jgi:hypothetical protein
MVCSDLVIREIYCVCCKKLHKGFHRVARSFFNHIEKTLYLIKIILQMQIILDYQLEFRQRKNLLILNISLLLIFLGIFSLEISSNVMVFQMIFGFILSISFPLLFLKKGLSTKNKELYYCYFLFEKKLFQQKINLENLTLYSTLKFNKSPDYAYFIGMYRTPTRNIDQSMQYSYKSFEIHLLNKKHTYKKKIIILQSEEFNEKTVSFIKENLNLKYEKYSPIFN